MDKGKSKTDLHAAGKKRLEKFRQKRQHKESSARTSSTTSLKALAESEQNSGRNAVEEISSRDSLHKEESQRSFSEKDGEVESAVDHVDEAARALDEQHHVNVVFDASPSFPVTSSFQTLKVGGGHLFPETSDQTVESPCEPGSSNGNSDDRDREAVYTILWENHGTDHSQRHEQWQESTFDDGASHRERALDQGNSSSSRVDDESLESESKEGLSAQRELSGNSVDAVDNFHSSEGIKEWDDPSFSLVPSQQRSVRDAEAEEGGRNDVLPVEPSSKGQSSFSNEENIEERMAPEQNEKAEKEKANLVSEVALLLQKLEQIVEESGREREFHKNEICSLQSQAREKDQAVSARNAQLEELEVAKALSEQILRTALVRTEEENTQLLQECMDVKSQVGRLAEERDTFLSSIDVYEKELEVLRADSTNLEGQMSNLSEEKDQLAKELCAVREQATAALEHEAQLLRNLRGLEKEREGERTRLQSLEMQLEDVISHKTQLEVSFDQSAKVLEDLRVMNEQLSEELAVSERERNMSRVRIKTLEVEQPKFHALIENLTRQLSNCEEKEAASEALHVQVMNSEEERKRLQFQVQHLEVNLCYLEDDKAEFDSKFRGLQLEKEELVTEVEILKNEFKVAQSQLEGSRTQQSEIVEELTTVKLELTNTLADKRKIQADEEQSRQKLEHLENQFEKVEIETNQSEELLLQKLQVTEENVAVLEEQKVGLEELLGGAKHDLEQLNKQLREIDAEKAELKETSAIAIEAFEQQVRRLGGEQSELEELCQTLRVELHLSNEKVSSLVAEKIGMETTAAMLHREAAVLDQRFNVLAEEKDRMVDELAGSQRALQMIHGEKAQLDSELQLLQEELRKMKEGNEHIRLDWETFQVKLNGITSEKEFVINQLKVSQDALQKSSEDSRIVASELSAMMKNLADSTELNNKLTDYLQSLQEKLQGAEEVIARVEIELEESLSKLSTSDQDKTLLSTKLDTLVRSVEVLQIEKVESVSQLQQLQEAIYEKNEEISMCKEEKKHYEVNSSAILETEVAKSHKLITEICNLKAELQLLKQQVLEERDNTDHRASDEPCSCTLSKESEHISLSDIENTSPRSHAANVKLVKNLVEVFEGKVNYDVPIQNQRDVESPVAQFFMQAQAMKKTSDDLQRDRDTAKLAESTIRADLDALTKKLHDVGEEGCNLKAIVAELQEKLAIATAGCSHLNQTIDILMNGDGEGVKVVAELKRDKCALQAQILQLAETLSAAEESIRSMLDYQALNLDLQKRSEDLGAKLETEKDASKQILSRLEFLSNFIEEQFLIIFPKLEWTGSSAEPVSRVEHKVALFIDKVLSELVTKVHKLEEERELARTDLHVMAESNNSLQVERSALISEKESLKIEQEVKMINETEARAVYEGHIKMLTSSLAEAENQLNLFKNERTDFEKKLLLVVNQQFPDLKMELFGTVESTPDFCWFLTRAILEDTSKKLEDMQTKLSHENSELNAIIAEERLQHQESFVDVEALREVLRQERDGLFEKVKFLEKELTLLQEEQERVSYEHQALLELESKAEADRQEKIQMLEFTVDDLQRGSEEREAEEAEARSVYERDLTLLNSRFQGIQSELDIVRDLHMRFDEKLEIAARHVLPVIEVKPVDFEDNLFDYSWAIVNLILEEYSRRLQHAHADMTVLDSNLNSGKEEEIRVLQELVHRITEELATAKEERNKVSEKVKFLENERMVLQEEQARVAHELELETKARADRQEKIQMLECTVDDLQRGLEEREAQEAEARSIYERDVGLLNSRLQSIQSELDIVRDLQIRFDEKLEIAARHVLPVIEVKPVDFEDNLFDYSWAIVNLILEEYSRRLQHAHADMTVLDSNLNSGKEEEIRVLQELVQRITEELAVATENKDTAQLELVQCEKRLASTKERLTLAINKGKSIVVQRDAAKASLTEKTGELQRVASDHKEMIRLKDVALQEAEAAALCLKAKADHAEILEVQLVEAHSFSKKLENSLSETRSALIDMEMAVDKITSVSDHVWENRVAKVEWVSATLKDLQMRLSYHESKTESLITDLTTASNEKENVLQKLQDVSLKFKQLQKVTDEDASSIAAQKSEIQNLEELIATMEAEAAQYIKEQHVISMAVSSLYSSGQDSAVDSSLANLFRESELGRAVYFHVDKYNSVVQELDELREQSVSLRDAVEKFDEEELFIKAEKLQSLQGRLHSRDIELREAITQLEGASRVIAEREEEAKAHMHQNESFKEQLIKRDEDLGILRSDFNLAEKKMMDLRNELLKEVYSIQNISEVRNSQPEGVTPSMNEMVIEVNALVKTVVEHAREKEMEFQRVNEREMAAFSQELSTSNELLSKFEVEFMDSRNAAQGISWLYGAAPPSSSLLDLVTWLIAALQEEHRKSEQAFQDIEAMTNVANKNALEMQHLREKSDSLFAELSDQRKENEAFAGELRSKDLERQIVQDKLQELAENNLALQSEVESARSLGHVENALTGIEEVVEDFRLQGRPSSTSSPTEWISWLIQIIQEVSQELKTSKGAADVLSLQAEEANSNYSSLYEELLNQKDDNENLRNKLIEVHETFNFETNSLKAEIQVLRNSSMAISSLEDGILEAQRAVTNLQETLFFKDRELSELRDKIEELSFRCAQQDSKVQSLMEEQERLSSEVVEVKAERNHLQTEMAQAVNEKSRFQSDTNQLEQKLVAVREKLNLAITKGKGIGKQRDSLKQSLAHETAKVESMVSFHAKEIQLKESEVFETRARVETMGTRVLELQAEVSSLRKKAVASQQGMQAERQRLESALSGFEVSKDVVFRDPIEKVEWLVSLLEGTHNTTTFLEGELDTSRNALETLKAVLMDTEERLQSVTDESLKFQETISLSVKKEEEVESRAIFDRAQQENEIDGLSRALKEADLRQQAAWSHVKELEKTVEKHQNGFNASEAARSKTVSKLTFTRNKLNSLVQDSQELVRECENLQKNLHERDAEIAELNHEVDRLKNIIHVEQSQNMDAGSESSLQLMLLQDELARTNEKCAATVKDLRELQVALQSDVNKKDWELEGVRRKIEDILLKGDNVLWMEHNIIHQNKGDDNLVETDVLSTNGNHDFAAVIITLEQRFDNLVAEAQLYKNESGKKEVQIQKLKKELHDVSVEKTTLQAGVQAKTMEVERLQSEVNKGIPMEDSTSAQSEIEELGTKSTWTGPGNPATPNVRGPRRHAQADVAIDMDYEDNSNLLLDMNDKEHGFSALTNSKLVPKATRILADRLDGLWFAGARILTRQPSARLGLAMYWIYIHVYMAMVFSRGIM